MANYGDLLSDYWSVVGEWERVVSGHYVDLRRVFLVRDGRPYHQTARLENYSKYHIMPGKKGNMSQKDNFIGKLVYVLYDNGYILYKCLSLPDSLEYLFF